MESDKRYFFEGLFIIVFSLAAALAFVWLAKTGHRDDVTYRIRFNESVSGMTAGDTVKFRGVDMGTVKAMAIDEADPRRVQVEVRLRKDTLVYTDTKASLKLRINGVVLSSRRRQSESRSRSRRPPRDRFRKFLPEEQAHDGSQLPVVAEVRRARDKTAKVLEDVGEVTKSKGEPFGPSGGPRSCLRGEAETRAGDAVGKGAVLARSLGMARIIDADASGRVESVRSVEADRVRRSLQQLAWLLDSSIPVPGTRLTVGVDALVGLFRVIGDLIGVALSSYILSQAARLGAPRSVLSRMAFNIAVEGVVGIIPLAGDIFDAAFKANQRNVQLLDAWLDQPKQIERSTRAFAALLICALVALLALLGAGWLLPRSAPSSVLTITANRPPRTGRGRAARSRCRGCRASASGRQVGNFVSRRFHRYRSAIACFRVCARSAPRRREQCCRALHGRPRRSGSRNTRVRPSRATRCRRRSGAAPRGPAAPRHSDNPGRRRRAECLPLRIRLPGEPSLAGRLNGSATTGRSCQEKLRCSMAKNCGDM